MHQSIIEITPISPAKRYTFKMLLLLLMACYSSAYSLTNPEVHNVTSHNHEKRSSATDTIYIANGEWPPYLSQRLDNYGPISQLVTEAFAEVNINVQYSFMPWRRGFEESSQDFLDGTLLWSKNAEREKLFLYSDTIMNLRYALFYRANEKFEWQTREDLYGNIIGAAIGYHYTLEAEHDQKLLTLERIRNPENNYFKLLSGRLDLVIENDAVGLETIQKLGLSEKIFSHPKPVTDMGYHLLIGKKNENGAFFIKKFNEGLAILKKTGRYDELMQAATTAQTYSTSTP